MGGVKAVAPLAGGWSSRGGGEFEALQVKWIRRIVLWAALAAIGLLVVLSAVGAFLGIERARAMFNSVPLAVFWFLLLGLLVWGFAAFKRLLASPGLLAVHLGSMLIVAGGLYGSEGGHALSAAWLGSRKIPSGYMTIPEGVSSYVVGDRQGRQVGDLPFRIGLKDFRLERYEGPGPWLLVVNASPAEGERERRQEVIDWVMGEEVAIPFTVAGVKVVQYLDSARPVYAEDALEVVQADGKKFSIPAKVGQEMTVENPKARLRILRVLSHMAVTGHGEDMRVLDLPDSKGPAALEIEVAWPDEPDAGKITYAIRGLAAHGNLPGLHMDYVFPELSGALAAPPGAPPAMELVITYKAGQVRRWLIAKDLAWQVQLSLAGLPGPQTAPAGGAHPGVDGGTYLILAPRQPIRDYFSHLAVFEENRQVAEKVIQVNDPLHYGGYHFYQHSYDAHGGRYTVLAVESDSGLWPVYAGFAMLCAGTFWVCWVRPAWRRLAGGRA